MQANSDRSEWTYYDYRDQLDKLEYLRPDMNEDTFNIIKLLITNEMEAKFGKEP